MPSTPPAGQGLSPGSAPPLGGVVPETGDELAAPEAEAPAQAPVEANGKSPSPAAPIGIGLASTALAIGAPWWLGRRFGW